MKSNCVFAACMVIGVVLCLLAPSSFGLILDQAQDLPATIGDGINQDRWTWQEFRPTMDNLERIDLLLQNDNVPAGINVSFELRKESTVLWSTSFPAASLPSSMDWFALDTPHIALIPEEAYQLCLTSPLTLAQLSAGINVIWWGERNDVYPRGGCSEPNLDFGFKTWAAPEPSTLVLLGMAAMGLRRKRRD